MCQLKSYYLIHVLSIFNDVTKWFHLWAQWKFEHFHLQCTKHKITDMLFICFSIYNNSISWNNENIKDNWNFTRCMSFKVILPGKVFGMICSSTLYKYLLGRVRTKCGVSNYRIDCCFLLVKLIFPNSNDKTYLLVY